MEWEQIDAIKAPELDSYLVNAVNCILRTGLKSESKLEDLQKASWYINREIEKIQKESL